MASVSVYCDGRSDELLAERYLVQGALSKAEVRRLPSLAAAPTHLIPLLTWERHDWVVTVDDEVCCAVEFSRHGYTGDNGFQRFARLFRSASLGIPTIYFTPFNRTRLNELDEGRRNPRNVAPELFETLALLADEYDVACLAVRWPTIQNGTPAPLNSQPAAKAFSTLCELVRDLVTSDANDSRALVRRGYPELATAMATQAAIAYRGTDTRRKVSLPLEIERPDWVLDWLPAEYFRSGKADKALASLALRSCSSRPVDGPATSSFWKNRGEAWVLFLGYQWRPDPSSGLIALAAARAKRLDLPLIVVWPRVFARRGAVRTGLVDALAEFQAGGTGAVAEELTRLKRPAADATAFRQRINVASSQFGVYSSTSKPGRILTDTADALVLGDAVLTFAR